MVNPGKTKPHDINMRAERYLRNYHGEDITFSFIIERTGLRKQMSRGNMNYYSMMFNRYAQNSDGIAIIRDCGTYYYAWSSECAKERKNKKKKYCEPSDCDDCSVNQRK